jgi:hypothetical protein
MSRFSCWCYEDNLVWVVQYAMTFGRHTIRLISEERSNVADYHVSLQFESDEQVNTFQTVARNYRKIITK